jgi:hypothetical protein
LNPSAALLDRHGAALPDQQTHVVLSEHVRPDFWFVGLLKEKIYARAFLDGKEIWHTETGYDRVRKDRQTPTQLAADAGPSLWKLSLDGGEVIPVCGPNGKDAIMAGALASIAVDRVIEARYQGRMVQVKVDDDELASLLLTVYGKTPHVIAEAIMALKKAGNGKERWLKQVLWSRPELRELAKKVDHELTGE